MTRALDIVSVVLMGGGIVAFTLGIYALGDNRDLGALYWMIVGALSLRTSADLLRPKAR